MSAKKFIVKNPDFRENILRHVERQFFMKHINCTLTTIEPGYVVAEIPLQDIHQQQLGLVHGGVAATIADVAAGFAGFTLVAPDEHTVTAEIKLSCLAPGRGVHLKAIGKVIRPGTNLHFCEADVFCIDEAGNETLIARATTTMAVIKPKNVKENIE